MDLLTSSTGERGDRYSQEEDIHLGDLFQEETDLKKREVVNYVDDAVSAIPNINIEDTEVKIILLLFNH